MAENDQVPPPTPSKVESPSSFRLLQFCKVRPALEFTIVNVGFHSNRTVRDIQKIVHEIALGNLSHDADIIKSPPESDKYMTIKQ